MDVSSPARKTRPSLLMLLTLLVLGAAPARESRAGDLYIETGFGVSQFRNGATLFNAPIESIAGLGAAVNLAFWWNMTRDYSDFQFHLGIKDRVSTAMSQGLQYVMHVPYPAVRIQLNHFYFGGGVTPLVLTRQGSLLGLSYDKAPSALAYMAEAGLLWKVVPYFHLSVEMGMQYVSTANLTMSPAPAVDLTLNLRFFLGVSGDAKGGEGSGRKFDGWRYPFGIELGGN